MKELDVLKLYTDNVKKTGTDYSFAAAIITLAQTMCECTQELSERLREIAGNIPDTNEALEKLAFDGIAVRSDPDALALNVSVVHMPGEPNES